MVKGRVNNKETTINIVYKLYGVLACSRAPPSNQNSPLEDMTNITTHLNGHSTL